MIGLGSLNALVCQGGSQGFAKVQAEAPGEEKEREEKGGGQVRGAKECANGLIGRCRELLLSEQSTRVTSKQEQRSRIYQLQRSEERSCGGLEPEKTPDLPLSGFPPP